MKDTKNNFTLEKIGEIIQDLDMELYNAPFDSVIIMAAIGINKKTKERRLLYHELAYGTKDISTITGHIEKFVGNVELLAKFNGEEVLIERFEIPAEQLLGFKI